MKKIIIAVVSLMLCIAVLLGFNVLQKSSTSDPLLKENIQALADDTIVVGCCPFLGCICIVIIKGEIHGIYENTMPCVITDEIDG